MRVKNNSTFHIGVDLLGSDLPPTDLLEAILSFCGSLAPSIHLTLFGLVSHFGRARPPADNVIFHPVKEEITMEDPPLAAIRKKKNSSLCTGIRMLKEGLLDAFVSSGNTGALMACAKLSLPSLAKVERPALLTLLPTKQNDLAVLDVGANTSHTAKHLIQFAAMGIAYQRSRGVKIPRVGLLNIGSEARKGTPILREVYSQLLRLSEKKTSSFTFFGNCEGRDVFHGDIDVLVTDGFTGNVFLKTAEGIAAVILEQLQSSGIWEECPPHLKGMLGELRQRLTYAEYPGALLCGVEGIIIKCHGTSSPQSLNRSIITAARLIEHGFLNLVRKELTS